MTSEKRSGPLCHLKVVELGGIGPAPFAAMMLAEMGADVVRIDRPNSVDTPVSSLDRGKRSVVIDLRHPDGIAATLRLVEQADVLVEGFRPGVIERLGIGPDVCWTRNPGLVIGRMTGWGQVGPLAGQAGHDINYIALTGALHAIGRDGEPPGIPLCLVGDLGGGALYLVVGILAALQETKSSGRGQVVDAAIVDGAAALMAPIYGMLHQGEWQDRRGVNPLDSGLPWYDVYRTSDGKWMAVGALEDRFYEVLVRLLGFSPHEADRGDPSSWPALRHRMASTFASATQAHWLEVFDGTDACVAPVLSMSEAPFHRHLVARQTFGELDGKPVPSPAPRFSRTPSQRRRIAPSVGADTRSVLHWWGVSNADGLLDAGVAVQAKGWREVDDDPVE